MIIQFTDRDIVLELHAPRGVKINLFEGLADNVIRLVLGLLSGLDGRRLVKISLVVNIEALEGIGKGKDLVLLELRKLPTRPRMLAGGFPRGAGSVFVPLYLQYVHGRCRAWHAWAEGLLDAGDGRVEGGADDDQRRERQRSLKR